MKILLLLAIILNLTACSTANKKTNAGSDSPDDTNDWVEAWNMTATHKDADSIYIYFVRSVNNFRMPYNLDTETEAGRFFT